ncbi:MAG: class E sortase [Actinomycetota bacterium]|nr:class E sortase [Actinomycetota bacterium]
MLRGIGQTLVTAGLVVLLFVVYEVYITNLFAHRAQQKVHSAFENDLVNGTDPLPGAGTGGIPLGTGIANLYIPRLGRDYAFTIVEGTGDSSLEKGPGHYVGTSLPGQVGDFAVAGHRVGKGEPFLNIDHLRPGDTVIVETVKDWFVYQVEGDVAGGEAGLAVKDVHGVPGREIVNPGNGDVIDPLPDNPGLVPTKTTPNAHYITMTTCHPKFTAAQRMIIHAQLMPSLTVARAGVKMPPSIAALYNAAGV